MPNLLRKILVLTSALLLPCLSCASQLAATEETRLKYCETGIAELDPYAAEQCLEEKSVIDKLRSSDPARAVKLIKAANTLKDLIDLLDIHTMPAALCIALSKRLEKGSPAAELGLGPEPERFLLWSVKHAPGTGNLVSTAIRQWQSLSPNEQQWLSSQNLSLDRWNRFSLGERNKELSEFALEEAQKLLATPGEISPASVEALRNRALDILNDLDAEMQEKLSVHLDRLEARLESARKAREMLKGTPAELKALDAELAGMKGLPVTEQLARLARFFENTPELRGSGVLVAADSYRESSPDETLTEKDKTVVASLLATALKKEISDTRAGSRLTPLFDNKDYPIRLKIASLPGMYGLFDNNTSEIIFSEERIQMWMRSNGFTAKDFSTGPEAVKQLAKFLSPAFVHEALHQEQLAWYNSKNLKKLYIQDIEIEAMSLEALYIIEKIKKDADFKEMLLKEGDISFYPGSSIERARIFLENPIELRRIVRSGYYPHIPSFETGVSVEMSYASLAAAEIKKRGNLPEREQERLEKEGKDDATDVNDIAKAKTSVLKELLDYYFTWNNEVKKKAQEEIAWTDKTRSEILAEKQPPLKSAPVPGPRQ